MVSNPGAGAQVQVNPDPRIHNTATQVDSAVIEQKKRRNDELARVFKWVVVVCGGAEEALAGICSSQGMLGSILPPMGMSRSQNTHCGLTAYCGLSLAQYAISVDCNVSVEW